MMCRTPFERAALSRLPSQRSCCGSRVSRTRLLVRKKSSTETNRSDPPTERVGGGLLGPAGCLPKRWAPFESRVKYLENSYLCRDTWPNLTVPGGYGLSPMSWSLGPRSKGLKATVGSTLRSGPRLRTDEPRLAGRDGSAVGAEGQGSRTLQVPRRWVAA